MFMTDFIYLFMACKQACNGGYIFGIMFYSIKTQLEELSRPWGERNLLFNTVFHSTLTSNKPPEPQLQYLFYFSIFVQFTSVFLVSKL